jgi:hypothetical protein
VTDLDPEDHKLITLARTARARTGAAEGAAVRDTDGRTYVATTVTLTSLSLSALQVAVAMAISSGALGLEAAATVSDFPDGARTDDQGIAALTELAPLAILLRADADGALVA